MHHQGGNVAIRKWTVVASLALCAALALTVASVGSAKPSKAQATSGLKVALVTDIGGLNDKSFNALAYKGLQNAEKKLGIDGRVFLSKSSADYIPNLSTGARSYDLVIGVGFLMARSAGGRREAVPGHEVRDRRLPGGRSSRARRRTCAASCSRSRRPAASPASRPATVVEVRRDRLGRRPEDPAGRRVHRRLPVLREEGQARHQDPERLLAGLRRPGEVQGDRAQPDPQKRRRGLPGRRPVRSRRAPGREGEQGLGHRRRRRPGLPRQAHPDERPEEGRRRRVQHDRARRHEQVEGRHRRPLQREERRRRVRQGQLGRAEPRRRSSAQAQRLDEAARRGQGQAPAHRQAASGHEAPRFTEWAGSRARPLPVLPRAGHRLPTTFSSGAWRLRRSVGLAVDDGARDVSASACGDGGTTARAAELGPSTVALVTDIGGSTTAGSTPSRTRDSSEPRTSSASQDACSFPNSASDYVPNLTQRCAQAATTS